MIAELNGLPRSFPSTIPVRPIRHLPTVPIRVTRIGTSRPPGTHRRRFGPLPLSLGIDLVSVAEVASALQQHGVRYIRRLFTTHEAAYCRAASPRVAAERFAARFAAKEATVKALRPARRWTAWRSIEVRRHKTGRPVIVLHGEAAALAARRGIAYLDLSMTHEGDLAAALVVATRTIDIRRQGSTCSCR
jgi:holo-[acyl-carrier protein] synthase